MPNLILTACPPSHSRTPHTQQYDASIHWLYVTSFVLRVQRSDERTEKEEEKGQQTPKVRSSSGIRQKERQTMGTARGVRPLGSGATEYRSGDATTFAITDS